MIILPFAGCSSRINNPTGIDIVSEISVNNPLMPVGVSDWIADGGPSAGMGVMGLFHVKIDPQNVSAEIVMVSGSDLIYVPFFA